MSSLLSCDPEGRALFRGERPMSAKAIGDTAISRLRRSPGHCHREDRTDTFYLEDLSARSSLHSGIPAGHTFAIV